MTRYVDEYSSREFDRLADQANALSELFFQKSQPFPGRRMPVGGPRLIPRSRCCSLPSR